ncbi:two-component system response regulator [Rufibacter glacialis]|uniref:Response regulator n=1 Tax=Rufibacter glacialis TaxID=1259555 RepID=A0A5M8QV69_9BACT|nr:response regulator [Rufibacter glacialis]KAA6438032.1 response regulator [Rufibacter glacialis]GGK89568.1 response regulator [Rufibacter glacialis]
MQRFRKVLLVSEDAISIYLHTILIERAGFAEETVFAANGMAACEILSTACSSTETTHTCPDLIFVDTHMQVMDGFEFLEAYYRLSLPCSPKIIMLSLSEDYKGKKRTMQFPEVGLLHKPLSTKDLNLIREETFNVRR